MQIQTVQVGAGVMGSATIRQLIIFVEWKLWVSLSRRIRRDFAASVSTSLFPG